MALANAAAESLVARDLETALRRAEIFVFTVVVASIDQAAIKDHLTLPTLLYGTVDAERDANSILVRLTRRLSS